MHEHIHHLYKGLQVSGIHVKKHKNNEPVNITVDGL